MVRHKNSIPYAFDPENNTIYRFDSEQSTIPHGPDPYKPYKPHLSLG